MYTRAYILYMHSNYTQQMTAAQAKLQGACKHSEYIDKIEDWKRVRKALIGGTTWAKEALMQYECEDEKDFELRLKSAFNRIKISTALRALQGLARGSKSQARITGAEPRIQQIVDEDFDNNGSDWYSWCVDKLLIDLPAYGKVFIGAASPALLVAPKLTDAKDVSPFVFSRTPLQVINWIYENGDTRTKGQFSDILFSTSEMVLNDETGFEDSVEILIRITKKEYVVIATGPCKARTVNGDIGSFSEGDIIRQFENKIGLVPFRCVDIGESIVSDAVNLSLQAMNIQSGCFMGTFDSNYDHIWTAGEEYPEGDVKTGARNITCFTDPKSTLNITQNGTSTIVNSVAFNDDLQQALDVMMQNEMTNLAKKGGSAPSGEALTQMNSSQAQAVGYLMDNIGNAILDIVAYQHLLAGLKDPADLKVKMPDTYESTTKSDAMTLTLDAQDIVVYSEEGLRAKLNEKWAPIVAPDLLEELVEAELKVELEILKSTQILDAAGVASGDTINQSSGDTINQDSGDAQNQGDTNADGS